MKVKTYILLLLLGMIACGCTKDSSDENRPTSPIGGENGTGENVPVMFSVSSQQIFGLTRTATSIDAFDANETIRVWVKPYRAESYVSYDYTTHESGANVALDPPATPPFFPANEPSTVEAYAYYPASATTTFTVRDDQTSAENYKASDLMFATNRVVTKEGTDGNDVLNMRHLMAQIRITANAQVGSGLNIIGVTVTAKNSVTFTPEGAHPTETVGDASAITALGAAGSGCIVVPPQKISEVTIKVITGEGTDAETATYVVESEDSIKAGLSYEFNLTVTAGQIGVTSFISDWNGMGTVNITPSGNLAVTPKAEDIAGLTYIGSAHEPGVNVYKDGTEVTDNNSYTLRYVNNINAGRAYIIVAGKDKIGEDDGPLKGCVGVTSFEIAKAAGTISYADASVEKTYGDDSFTNTLTKVGDGTVTYASSDATVATVDASNGQVTLLKSGETTITATVVDGSNYTYATKTASYTLTVAKKAASISFADFPVKTWSATVAENTFTPTLTNTGTSAVTYTLTDNTCGATISGNTVSFTQAGAVTVTATVEDNDCYTYAVKSISNTLTVNKHAGILTLDSNSGSVRAGNSTTITVSNSHGGTLSAQTTNDTDHRVTITDGPGDNQFTVQTEGTSSASITIAVTCATNNYYLAKTVEFTLTIEPAFDYRRLPLHYMAVYNVADVNGTSFATQANAGYYYTWSQAMTMFAKQTTSYDKFQKAGKGPDSQWHLPVRREWLGIVGPVTTPTYMWGSSNDGSLDNGTGHIRSSTSGNHPIWGYNDATQSGIVEHSYWKKKSSTEMHAIRFLGTDYCSAWKYVISNDMLTIYAKLIETVENDATKAAKWYTDHFSSITFEQNASEGALTRTIYERGYIGSGSGPTSTEHVNQYAKYWSATQYSSESAYRLFFYDESCNLVVDYLNKGSGFPVRLFRDIPQ